MHSNAHVSLAHFLCIWLCIYCATNERLKRKQTAIHVCIILYTHIYILVQFCWTSRATSKSPAWVDGDPRGLSKNMEEPVETWKAPAMMKGAAAQRRSLAVGFGGLELVASHHDCSIFSWLSNIIFMIFVTFFRKNVSGNALYTVGCPYSLYCLASRNNECHCKHQSDCHGPPVGCTARMGNRFWVTVTAVPLLPDQSWFHFQSPQPWNWSNCQLLGHLSSVGSGRVASFSGTNYQKGLSGWWPEASSFWIRDDSRLSVSHVSSIPGLPRSRPNPHWKDPQRRGKSWRFSIDCSSLKRGLPVCFLFSRKDPVRHRSATFPLAAIKSALCINSDWLRMWLTGKHFNCELNSFDSIDQDESFLQIALQDMDMLDTLAERIEAWEIDKKW